MSTNIDWNYIYKEFAEPFSPDEVSWKPQAFNKSDKNKALLVAFVDARTVADRLNSVVGVQNWKTEFTPVPAIGNASNGEPLFGVSCRLYVYDTYKEDVGTPSMADGLKGSYSDALKRAAVHFGIGRYIYELGSVWGELDNYKKVVNPPKLPAWALPGGSKTPDEVIFSLARELGFSQEVGLIMHEYRPGLAKVELKSIYLKLKELQHSMETNK